MNSRQLAAWAEWESSLIEVERSDEALYMLLDPSGQVSQASEWPFGKDFVFFKGSFDPIHRGHTALFTAAISKYGGTSGAYALSFDTRKRQLTLKQVRDRTRLIHEAGYPVIVSRTGLFAHDAAFFRRMAPDLRIVFPMGIDVLLRLLKYYGRGEFARLFPNAVFEYCRRGGFPMSLALEYRQYPNIHELSAVEFPNVNSSMVRQLAAVGARKALRGLMPPPAGRTYLSIVQAGANGSGEGTANGDVDARIATRGAEFGPSLAQQRSRKGQRPREGHR